MHSRIFLSKTGFVEPFGVSLSGMLRLSAPIGSTISTELQQLYPGGINGFEAPKEEHYHFGKKPGDQTHYGDGALVLLESLAKEGRFDAKAFGRQLC